MRSSGAIRWIAPAGDGEMCPLETGRKPTSPLDRHEEFILALVVEKKNITLYEIVVRLLKGGK